MPAVQERATSVKSRLIYLEPTHEHPFNYICEPPAGTPWENCSYESREVAIADAREFFLAPALDANGFELADAPSAVRDFRDQGQILEKYHPEMQALALRITGGRQAHVFDHLVRRREAGRPPMTLGRRGGNGQLPGAAGRVHNDYTEQSGRRRLSLVLGEEQALQVRGRYCIVNIWRSIRGPVIDTPLALCDARSVAPDDLVPTEIRYADRAGEIYQLRVNPAHRWAYFHELRQDEAIVFKQFDNGKHVSRFTPHAAFDHPATPPGAPLRESIEARVLVVF